MVLLCDFSHLDSFSYPVNGILVRFSYSNHVFTDKSSVILTPSHSFYDDKGNKRAFDDQRYIDSIQLQNHLRNLSTKKIYDERHGNAFYFPQNLSIYRIILSIKRSGKDVAVRVESAHRLKTPLNLKHEKSMNFYVAVKRAYQGDKLFPRKK